MSASVYRVLSEWKDIIFIVDLGISKHKDCLAAETVFFYKAKSQGDPALFLAKFILVSANTYIYRFEAVATTFK
jgi:hypothetical protein